MSCNIWFIIILIIIALIIGLISFSNYKLNNLELFTANNTNNTTTISFFDNLENANSINVNNNKINNLISTLQTINPNIELINYKPETVYSDMQNNITSNVNTIATQLSAMYNSKIALTDTKLTTLENTITDLENTINNLGLNTLKNNAYSTIKSFNNGMEMQIVRTPNTTFQDAKTGAKMPGYMVMANNGCLSVGANDYDIYQCNDKNPKQLFKMEHIINETAYKNNIDNSLPLDITDKAQINYPFIMMKSLNNDNCLTNNHGNLTVQPCYSFVAQRWGAH